MADPEIPSLPSLCPVGAFGMMGTAFEELGRGACLPLLLFFFLFLLL